MFCGGDCLPLQGQAKAMTARPSFSRQASAVSALIKIVGGARAKPRNPSELAMLLDDARAAERTLFWLEEHRDAVLVAIGGETIGKDLAGRNFAEG
jgi:hypothetical protein